MEQDLIPMGYYYFEQVDTFIEHLWHIDNELKRDGILVLMNSIRLLKVVSREVRFLRLFCRCLERWDFTSDEQSRERLRSMLTDLDLIWGKEQDERNFLYRMRVFVVCLYRWAKTDNCNAHCQDFHSFIIELQGKIHQSKLQIVGWCGNLLPLLMHCKPSTIHEVMHCLEDVETNLLGYFFSAKIIVPLENHIDILTNMIDFLLDSLENCRESNNSIEFLNFARAFSNKAACLACLYWAKEANIIEQSTSTEMNIAPFAIMMLEFIPCVPDFTSSYFDILRSSSQNVLPSRLCWHHIFLEETVASVVDFFFEHLATVLKDDFPILRDQLIYLFTFITDHPAEENDLICNQTYALFREHAYLLVSSDEMKEDFSKNNMILREFMIKIDIANANIRQRYFAFSYSWIGSEAIKMDYLYFVLVQRAICAVKYSKHAKWSWPSLVRSQLQLYVMELGFLRSSLLWFATLDDGDEEIRSRLNSVIVSLLRIWEKEEENRFLVVRLDEVSKGERNIVCWNPLAFELEGKIELSKLEISTHLVNEFHWSLQNKPSTSNKVLKFIDSILQNLNSLVSCRAGKILSFKKQIETLEDKLVFLQNMLKLAEKCTNSKDLGEFIMLVQLFANQAARLTIMYWVVKDADDKIATEINLILSRMLQMIKPATPGVARLYFETFKAIYLQRSDPLLFDQAASIFVDFVLEDSVTLFKDDFQNFRVDVIFLLTFLNDPIDGNDDELICSQIENSFWEDVYGLLSIDATKGDFPHKMVRLSDFMMKIKAVNTKIRKLHCEFPDSSLYDVPKITSPWYLDFLIQNLRNLKERMITDNKFVLFVKYNIVKFEDELVSLSHFFNHIFELQNELNDTWLEVVDLVYLCERAINTCVRSWFVFDRPIWYYMAYLEDVFDRIKVIKPKLEKIKETKLEKVICLPHSPSVIRKLSKQAWTSEINEVMVGFEDEAKKLSDVLTSGHKLLDIVSIVGMGGLGKTTLARKVLSLVKDHFHISAFYSVSQDHNIRMLLLGILKFIIKVDDEISRMTNDDLAHKLWKCLSHKKYLIVLDDIWNTSVWNEIKRSLPDNKNGSRVMFTTRFHDVANKCKIQCSPFHLRFLSKVESWELLQKKAFFQNGISPPELFNIGMQIAESCKGLPLAIVVIAGLLARKERSKSWWSEIAEKVYSILCDEGCMKILELSYNHLPEYLKPCLLYLGAFPEDKLFTVNQVTRLWIAEGFVHEYETKSVDDVAKEYFHDLVDRSLMIVSARGSDGEIKTFSVHDLIHKLCQTKCHEGNFFKIGRGIAASTSVHDHYRISDLDVSPTISSESSSLENASTLLLFTDQAHDDSSFRKLKLVQVLYLESKHGSCLDLTFMTSLINLRHLEYNISSRLESTWLPQSISHLWNIQSLIVTSSGTIYMPETLWKVKSLKLVEVGECVLQFSDGHEHEQLDKVISFSRPLLYSGKEVERLLQRLPVVRKLGIKLAWSPDDVDTLDFFRKLESLKISGGSGCSYLINFPSTLKKLTLENLNLQLTTISSIVELHYLQVLKLRRNSLSELRLEKKDLVFNHLVFFELYDSDLVEWKASTESFPCLEQLLIECQKLEELPPCFGEIPALKRIAVKYSSQAVEASALLIQEEQNDFGKEVEVTIEGFSSFT